MVKNFHSQTDLNPLTRWASTDKKSREQENVMSGQRQGKYRCKNGNCHCPGKHIIIFGKILIV